MLALADLEAGEDDVVDAIIAARDTLVAAAKRVDATVRTTKAMMKEIRPENMWLALSADIRAIRGNTAGLPIAVVDVATSIAGLAASLTTPVPTRRGAGRKVGSGGGGAKGGSGSLLPGPGAGGDGEDDDEDSILSDAV